MRCPQIVSNCSCERSLEHCHCHAFLSLSASSKPTSEFAFLGWEGRPHFLHFPRSCSLESPQTLVSRGWEGRPYFPHFPCIWELRNIYHHHPESKKRKSSEANSGSIHPHGRYENAVKTRKTISTIAILLPVKAIFEKRAATVEVDTLISPVLSGVIRANRFARFARIGVIRANRKFK